MRLWLGLILVFGVLGSLERINGVPLGLFDLDGEGKPPAAFSALLLVCAGATAIVISRLESERGRRGMWVFMGLFLAYMALDEGITIHEHLEDRTGISWVKLYAPLVLAGGIGWLFVVRRIWPLGRHWKELGPRLFALAPGPWLLATILEMTEAGEGGRVNGYTVMATIEELLEMVGDGFFLLGLLTTYRVLAAYPKNTRASA
jgi:hypothetical protein